MFWCFDFITFFFLFICWFVCVRQLKEKKDIPVALPNGFSDPLEEIDHDAEKLAQEFERKYGNGYDENNGFIDDSEAVNIQIQFFFCFLNKSVISF